MCTLARSGDWQEWVSGSNSWCRCCDICAVPRVKFCRLQPDQSGCVPICGCSDLGMLLQWIFPKCNQVFHAWYMVKQSLPSWGNWEICPRGAHLTQPKSLLYAYIFTRGGFDVGYTIIQGRVYTGGSSPPPGNCWVLAKGFLLHHGITFEQWQLISAAKSTRKSGETRWVKGKHKRTHNHLKEFCYTQLLTDIDNYYICNIITVCNAPTHLHSHKYIYVHSILVLQMVSRPLMCFFIRS